MHRTKDGMTSLDVESMPLRDTIGINKHGAIAATP